MIHYFTGTNIYAARQAIEASAQQKKIVRRWIDREDLASKSLLQWCDQAASGLFNKELIVVRDPSAMTKVIQADIVATLPKIKNTECIFWDRIAPDRRSSLYRALKTYLTQFDPLPPLALTNWLEAEAKQRGVSFDKNAAQELMNRVGSDQWQLMSELEKLSLVNKNITIATVVDSVPPRESPPEIFVMLDELAAGRVGPALAAMEAILKSGASELYVLSMLAYQFRTLITIKNGALKQQSAEAIAASAQLHPFVVKKNMSAANRYNMNVLLAHLTKIMATDFAIKQGKVDMRTGLVMTVASLAN